MSVFLEPYAQVLYESVRLRGFISGQTNGSIDKKWEAERIKSVKKNWILI